MDMLRLQRTQTNNSEVSSTPPTLDGNEVLNRVESILHQNQNELTLRQGLSGLIRDYRLPPTPFNSSGLVPIFGRGDHLVVSRFDYAVFAPHGTYLAATDAHNNKLVVWRPSLIPNLKGPTEDIDVLHHKGDIVAMAVNETFIAVATKIAFAVYASTPSLSASPIIEPYLVDNQDVRAIAISPTGPTGGMRLVVAYETSLISIWHLVRTHSGGLGCRTSASVRLGGQYEQDPYTPTALGVSNNGGRVAVGCTNGYFFVYTLEDSNEGTSVPVLTVQARLRGGFGIPSIPPGITFTTLSFLNSSNSNILALTSWSKYSCTRPALCYCDTRSQTQNFTYLSEKTRAQSICVAPNGYVAFVVGVNIMLIGGGEAGWGTSEQNNRTRAIKVGQISGASKNGSPEKERPALVWTPTNDLMVADKNCNIYLLSLCTLNEKLARAGGRAGRDRQRGLDWLRRTSV